MRFGIQRSVFDKVDERERQAIAEAVQAHFRRHGVDLLKGEPVELLPREDRPFDQFQVSHDILVLELSPEGPFTCADGLWAAWTACGRLASGSARWTCYAAAWAAYDCCRGAEGCLEAGDRPRGGLFPIRRGDDGKTPR